MTEKFKLLDLFSGIGGFSLGLERSGGFETVAFCEIDPFARKLLAKHWPGTPIYDDIRTLSAERLRSDGIAPNAIAGGFPCQDLSLAGNGAGLEGSRSGLWFEYLRLIDELRPKIVAVENVAALVNRGLGTVLGGLAGLRYDAEWRRIPASEAGAPHYRDRIWLVAYPSGTRRPGLVPGADISQAGPWRLRGAEDLQSIASAPFERGDRWPQPLLRRVDDGLRGRIHRLRVVGNSIVPQIPRAIMESMK